jgi:hypothetical protein
MSQRTSPAKLVVEWRYSPQLGGLSTLDSMGVDLLPQYPEWERSPLTLEMRNLKRHRRVFMALERSFFEADGIADLFSELETAAGVISKVCSTLKATKLERLGVRAWYAVDLGVAFAALVDRVTELFLRHGPDLEAIYDATVRDVGYVMDLETSEGYKFNVRLGPMLKDQWLRSVPYERGIYEQSTDQDAATFKKHLASLPDQFLYMDFDLFRHKFDASEARDFVGYARRRIEDTAQALVAHSKGSPQ